MTSNELEGLHLRTKRLHLRVIDETCAERVLAFVNRNRTALAEWEPARDDSYYTLETQLRIIQDDRHNRENGRGIIFWLTEADDPGEELIGSISLSNIVRGAFHSCHLGYRMDERHRNKGLMTEALAHVCAFGFESLNLHRIEANVMPRNAASLKVCERLGFHEEGLARDYLRIQSRWEDHIHMVLLNSAWHEG